MKFVWSIKKKLVLISILVSASITISISAIVYHFVSIALEKQMLNSLTTIAASREHAILGLLKSRLQHLEILAANETIQNLMVSWNKKEDSEKIDDKYLEERAKSFFDTELPEFSTVTEFLEYVFISRKGRIYYSTDQSLMGLDFSSDDRFIRGISRPLLGDVKYDSKLKRYFREIIVPVFPHQAVHDEAIGAVVGVITSKVGIEKLNEITTNREGLGQTGEVYVVNKDGYMITESRFIKDAILKQKVDTKPVKLEGFFKLFRNWN